MYNIGNIQQLILFQFGEVFSGVRLVKEPNYKLHRLHKYLKLNIICV